jgi:hypothetical protein
MKSQQKIVLGTSLAALAGAFMAAAPVLGWSSLSRSGIFISGLLIGMLAGLGVVLAIQGLITNRRAKSQQS